MKTRNIDAARLHSHPLGHLAGPTANRTAGSSSLFRSEGERADVELGFRPVRDGEQVSDELWAQMKAAVHPPMTATSAASAPTPAPTQHASARLLPENFRRDRHGVFYANADSPTKELVDSLIEEKLLMARFDLQRRNDEWNQRVRAHREATGQGASAALLRHCKGDK